MWRNVQDKYLEIIIVQHKVSGLTGLFTSQYSIAQMCTSEDKLAHYLGEQFIDDVMRHNTLITKS